MARARKKPIKLTCPGDSCIRIPSLHWILPVDHRLHPVATIPRLPIIYLPLFIVFPTAVLESIGSSINLSTPADRQFTATMAAAPVARKQDLDRIKGPWSPEEDEALHRLVEKHGARNWSLISRAVPGRSGKSCRLRWCNQLSPRVEHRAFAPEEDEIIVRAHARFGNKWATIARLLSGRTDNAIKNHWNSTLKRKCRAAGSGDESPSPSLVADDLLPPLPKRARSAADTVSASCLSLSPGSPDSDVTDGSPPAVVYRPVPHAVGVPRPRSPSADSLALTLSLSSPAPLHSRVEASVTPLTAATPLPVRPPSPRPSAGGLELFSNYEAASTPAVATGTALPAVSVTPMSAGLVPTDIFKFPMRPEFAAIVQEMIRKEVVNYLSGGESRPGVGRRTQRRRETCWS